MTKDHSDSKRRNLLPPLQGISCCLAAPPDRIAHSAAFDTPVVEHWLEQEIAHCFHHEQSI